MNTLLMFAYEGGPMVFPMIGGLMWGLLLGVLRVALSGRARFLGLGAATLLGMTCLGLLGTFHGFHQVFEAVAHAAAEHKEELFAYGNEVAALTVKGAAVCVAFLAPLHLIAVVRESATPPRALQLAALGLGGLLLLLTLVDLGLLAAYYGVLDTFAERSPLSGGQEQRAIHMAVKITRTLNAGMAVSVAGFLLSLLLGVVSLATGVMSMAKKTDAAA